MPLTTRPSATSRHGMMRLASTGNQGSGIRRQKTAGAMTGSTLTTAMSRPQVVRRFPTSGSSVMFPTPVLRYLIPGSPFRRLERRLEVELALVERASGNRADDALALVVQQVLDI